MSGRYWPEVWDDEGVEFEVPEIEVEVTSDGIVGTILGPDGEPLRTVRRPFGFTRR